MESKGFYGFSLNSILIEKIAAMHWSEPKSYRKPFDLLHSSDFRSRGHWSGYRNSLCQSRFLTETHQPFSLLLNVHFIFPVRSYWFFNLASVSIDGGCLYIIIYYGMPQREWGIRSVCRGGRPDPESFKATDTYTYSKNHTNSPCVCLRML